MRQNKILLIFLVCTLLIGVASASGYIKTNNIEFNDQDNYAFGDFKTTLFDNKMCEEGQDFVIQIAPGGCSPAIVRSDLLEEQDVPVFCELQAIKVNPLANIQSIDSMTFSHQGSDAVRTVGFQPAYDALGKGRTLTDSMWNNIGSAVFILKQNKNESSMPEIVSGNLTATLRYDMENGFGLRKHTFYLPLMSDGDFERKMGQYAFFDHRGYLRAEDIQPDSATFTVYSGRLQNPAQEGSSTKQKVQSYDLKKGEKTAEILLPGLDCMSAVEFKLDSIGVEDVRAQIKVNSEVLEVGEEEKFLGDKCRIVDDGVKKNGLNQQVKMTCKGDDKTETFTLRISPSLKISIDGVVNQYELGQELFVKDGRRYFLGYVGYSKNPSTNEDELDASIVSIPDRNVGKGYRLTENQLENVACVRNKDSAIGDIGCATYGIARWLIQGDEVYDIGLSSTKVAEKTISISGLGVGGNSPLVGEKADVLQKYFNLANEDYSYVFTNFESEKYPKSNFQTLSEESLFEKMQLAKDLWQKGDFSVLCEEFKSRYPQSKLDDSDCDDVMYQTNYGISSHEILIDGDFKEISLQRVNMPSVDDYGLELYVGGEVAAKNNLSRSFKMGKEGIVYLDANKTEWIQLVSIGEKSAKFRVKLEKLSTRTKIKQSVFSTVTLKENEVNSFGSDYDFVIKNIKVSRVAKIVVNPKIKYTGSKAEFKYHIGIEKRDIQLSPEMTKDLIDKLNSTIEKFNSINSKLGKVIDTMEDACLATGAALNIKNLLFNAGGEAIAREKVMDHWKVYCAEAVNEGAYSSQSQCYFKNADAIDDEVDTIAAKLNEQDSKIKSMQKVTDTGLFGDKIVDTDDLAEKYSKVVAKKLNEFPETVLTNKNRETINLKEIASRLTVNGWENGIYDLDELKEIELNLDLYESTKDDRYKENLFNVLAQVRKNSEHVVSIERNAEKYKIDPSKILSLSLNEKVRDVPYTGLTLKSISWSLPGLSADELLQIVQTNKGTYYVLLEDIGTNEMTVKRKDGKYQIYDSERILLDDPATINQLTSNFRFVKIDEKTYNNRFVDDKEFVVKYYEVEPYKGLPAIVPLDKGQGWYAYIKQTVPAFGKTASYDDSGRITHFDLCNVGKNGLLQADKGMGDDVCQTISLTSGVIPEFYGYDKTQTKYIVDTAVKAILAASKQHGSGVSAINVNGQRVKVGSPLVNLPAGDCTDYMSPKECQLLFNVCDPVVCPASRCDLGGAYPVQDVVQSGIVGSLALCLPNAQEGIYMPVCLTGVSAGLDGFNSVLGAYRECLQQNLETGETVGICDEIHSVQLCEFFWRQGLPLAKIAVPKLLKLATGQTTRGGGEYSGVEKAWKNAQDSVSFFTEFYAVNAFKVFKARGQEEIGSELCNSFVSTAYPKGQGIFDSLSLSTSPPQFNANFDAIPMTSQTNPPMVHYKVYYHIYAGNDRGAYFKVYLRGSESSYYQDASTGRIVGSGYIQKGESKTITEDFTGPQGYKELCVLVNDQEECGFGKVSTSFSANYVKDQYILGQAKQGDIKSEKECISGTASAASLLNLNVQSVAEELIDPAIYNKGLIRVCATNAPGSSTDPAYGTSEQRWMEVGYCDDRAMKCWIDRDSVDDAVNFETTYDTYLNDSTNDYLNKIYENENYLNEEEFDNFADVNLSKLENQTESAVKVRVNLIDAMFPKVFLNNQKAYLFLKRGITYGDFAKYLFSTYTKPALEERAKYDEEFEANKTEGKEEYNLTVEEIDLESYFNSEFISPKFEFKDGKLAKNLCFRYFDDSWHWTKDCSFQDSSIVKKVDTDVNEDLNIYKEWNDLDVADLNKYNRDFIIAIHDKNFIEGSYLFTQRTLQAKEGASNPEFVSRGVTLEKDAGVFAVNFELVSDGKLVGAKGSRYFRFENNKWEWAVRPDTKWVSAGTLTNSDEQTKDKKTGNLGIQKLIKMLSVMDYTEGISLIYSGSEFRETIVLPEGLESEFFESEVDWRIFNERCRTYEDAFITASEETGVPLNILVSMAHQESRCDSSAESDSSYGIMQINPTYWCGKHGIPADDYQCKKVLIEDPRANIIAGAKIVKELYDQYSVKGVKFNGCEIQRYYYGWEAAVRAYNGLGCNKDYPEQDNYVEEVMTRAGEAFTGGEKVDDTLDEDESIAAKLANLEALKAGKWPIEDTMAFCKSLTGKYSSSKVNRQFVDELCIQNVLDSKKCSDIKGEGIFNLEEDMDTVYVALELKKAEIAGKRNVFFSEKETVSFGFSDLRDSNWPMTDTIKYAGGLKGKYSANDENKFFVDALCSDEILDAAQCDDVKGVGLFDLEEDMMEVTEMLKIRLIKLSKEEVSVGKDMTIQQALSKAKILSDAGREDNSFITDVYDAEYITDQQYDLAIERGMSFLVSVLEANIKEAEEAKETKDSSSTTSETCPEVEVLDSAKSASSAVDKVMATIDELEGKPRFEGSAGCFSSVEFVYDSAGVDFRKCYYSDATGKQYVTGVVTQSADPTKPFYVNTNCEIRDISENRKLNGLEAGDLIDLAYDVEQSHNVIFIEWVNAAEKIAKIFDWNGEAGTYAYSNYDLSDDSHPVYMYRKPFLA